MDRINVNVGDSVVIVEWSKAGRDGPPVERSTVERVTPSAGIITLGNGRRFDKHGHEYGKGHPCARIERADEYDAEQERAKQEREARERRWQVITVEKACAETKVPASVRSLIARILSAPDPEQATQDIGWALRFTADAFTALDKHPDAVTRMRALAGEKE